ncbi:hypothetical protein ABPG74_019116 [Tetrahymena malaccensis]
MKKTLTILGIFIAVSYVVADSGNNVPCGTQVGTSGCALCGQINKFSYVSGNFCKMTDCTNYVQNPSIPIIGYMCKSCFGIPNAHSVYTGPYQDSGNCVTSCPQGKGPDQTFNCVLANGNNVGCGTNGTDGTNTCISTLGTDISCGTPGTTSSCASSCSTANQAPDSTFTCVSTSGADVSCADETNTCISTLGIDVGCGTSGRKRIKKEIGEKYKETLLQIDFLQNKMITLQDLTLYTDEEFNLSNQKIKLDNQQSLFLSSKESDQQKSQIAYPHGQQDIDKQNLNGFEIYAQNLFSAFNESQRVNFKNFDKGGICKEGPENSKLSGEGIDSLRALTPGKIQAFQANNKNVKNVSQKFLQRFFCFYDDQDNVQKEILKQEINKLIESFKLLNQILISPANDKEKVLLSQLISVKILKTNQNTLKHIEAKLFVKILTSQKSMQTIFHQINLKKQSSDKRISLKKI